MNRWNVIKFVGLVFFIVVILFGFYFTNISEALNTETIQDIVTKSGIWAPLTFVVLATLGVIMFFPGALISIAAGAIFPFWLAVTLVFLADVLGATIVFLFSRYMGRGFANDLLDNRFKKLKSYNDRLGENGLETVLFLRLVPIFPFNGLNYTLALTKISFMDYFLGTLLGIIPGNIVYVYLGNSIVHNQTRGIIIAISVILILIAVGYIIRKRNAKFPFIML